MSSVIIACVAYTAVNRRKVSRLKIPILWVLITSVAGLVYGNFVCYTKSRIQNVISVESLMMASFTVPLLSNRCSFLFSQSDS